jgi:hypothetical protein
MRLILVFALLGVAALPLVSIPASACTPHGQRCSGAYDGTWPYQW